MRGMRIENFTFATLPSSSSQNIGRLMYATDTDKVYLDNGTAVKTVGGVAKFLSDSVWNGSDITKTVTVSSDIEDARNAIWAIHDNANDFERIFAKITAISATQIKIDVSPALPAGSYRIIGLE